MAELRIAIERNIRDYFFEKQSDGRIIYLFDASVIQIFLNPARESRHVSTFNVPAHGDDSATTAMITAEFLFSRQLSGQNGSPAFITEAHAEDVSNMVRRITERVKDYGDSTRSGLADPGSRPDGVRAVLAKTRIAGLEGKEALQTLASVLPSLAAELLGGPAHEAQQFRRLVNEDLVRPLKLLPEATDEILSPDGRLVDSWRRLLIAEGKQHGPEIGSRSRQRSRGDPSHARAERIRRDATTMAQLLLLNDGAREDACPTRYVLVTTDRTMARAYGRWFFGGGRGPFDAYALRHPLQYVPMLNAEQMKNGVERSELVSQIRDVLDSLFQFVQEDGGDYFQMLSVLADPSIEPPSGASLSNYDEKILRLMGERVIGSRRNVVRALEERWAEASKGALLLNSELIQRHFREDWNLFSGMIENTADFQRGVLDYLDDLMQGLEAAHAKFVIDGFLGYGPGFDAKMVRYPLFLRSTSPTIMMVVAARSLKQVDDAVQAIRRPPSARGEFVGGDDQTTLVLAACVAFRVGQWQTASSFAVRALKLLKSALLRPDRDEARTLGDVHELFYLEAACTRFRVAEGGNFEPARAQLNESATFYRAHGDTFGLVRTLSEQGALKLAFVYAHEMQRRSSLGYVPDVLRAFLEAADALAAAVKILGDLPARKNDQMARHLESQTLANFISAQLYDMHFAQTETFDLELVDWVLLRLEEIGDSVSDVVLPLEAVEQDYIRWTRESDETVRRRSSPDLIDRAVEALAKVKTPLELWVVEQIVKWVKAETLHRSPTHL